MQMYGRFDGFPLHSALFGLVSYNDHPPVFQNLVGLTLVSGWKIGRNKSDVASALCNWGVIFGKLVIPDIFDIPSLNTS